MTVELNGPTPDPVLTNIALPCLHCMHDKACAIKSRIGGIYLALAAGLTRAIVAAPGNHGWMLQARSHRHAAKCMVNLCARTSPISVVSMTN